jgi:hypothetical protein
LKDIEKFKTNIDNFEKIAMVRGNKCGLPFILYETLFCLVCRLMGA